MFNDTNDNTITPLNDFDMLEASVRRDHLRAFLAVCGTFAPVAVTRIEAKLPLITKTPDAFIKSVVLALDAYLTDSDPGETGKDPTPHMVARADFARHADEIDDLRAMIVHLHKAGRLDGMVAVRTKTVTVYGQTREVLSTWHEIPQGGKSA